MSQKRYTTEQIIGLLRRAEVLVGQGKEMAEVSREIGVTGNTYYRWRKEYGGMGTDQVRRLKELEVENARLKRALADLTLDIHIRPHTSWLPPAPLAFRAKGTCATDPALSALRTDRQPIHSTGRLKYGG